MLMHRVDGQEAGKDAGKEVEKTGRGCGSSRLLIIWKRGLLNVGDLG